MGMENFSLGMVALKDIQCTDRHRIDLGNIDELVDSFKKYGVIQPLAVVKLDDSEKMPYRLLAGGRRFMAAAQAKLSEVPVKIFLEDLDQLEMECIELEENLNRKDLNWEEECNAKRRIHDLMVKLYGEKISTSPDAPGHSLRDTAKLLKRDPKGVSADIRLAKARENFPDLNWSKCKTKSDAVKLMNRFEERVARADLSEKASKLLDKSSQKMIDSYIVGDFFERVKGIPDKSINLVEVDPPYSIDLPEIKKDHKLTYGNSYNEIADTHYMKFIVDTLAECYRVMSEDSWLIFWFGPEPWLDYIYHAITEAGFKTRRICGIWTKSSGQTMHPDKYLANSYEMFFYARKGDAKINLDKRGRSNIFAFNPVNPAAKIHPTERPVEMMEELLNVFAWEGSRVLVPFAGSGNTLRAAYNCKMFPIGYDLSQEYKDGYASRIVQENL